MLNDGISELPVAPTYSETDDLEAIALVRSAFELHQLDLAGPRLEFDAVIALQAAKLLAKVCWVYSAYLDDSEIRLGFEVEPRTASAHLSADVALRFLPTVLRRAKLRDPESALTKQIGTVLCRWPLSGVLADLEAEPVGELDFHGHRGLQMLYAERLVRFPRTKWMPTKGTAREWVEAVFVQQEKPLPVVLTSEETESV